MCEVRERERERGRGRGRASERARERELSVSVCQCTHPPTHLATHPRSQTQTHRSDALVFLGLLSFHNSINFACVLHSEVWHTHFASVFVLVYWLHFASVFCVSICTFVPVQQVNFGACLLKARCAMRSLHVKPASRFALPAAGMLY